MIVAKIVELRFNGDTKQISHYDWERCQQIVKTQYIIHEGNMKAVIGISLLEVKQKLADNLKEKLTRLELPLCFEFRFNYSPVEDDSFWLSFSRSSDWFSL